jgi:hypothetical protein
MGVKLGLVIMLRKQHKLRMFENIVLRKTLGTKRELERHLHWAAWLKFERQQNMESKPPPHCCGDSAQRGSWSPHS